ncbi:hypothetical protein SPHINGO8AM_90156 [Sphingomonas sp. 8AM]|nr:hypothetical protein SPHINGO8AM_90156 [Sphingomonas sp. 8AM]
MTGHVFDGRSTNVQVREPHEKRPERFPTDLHHRDGADFDSWQGVRKERADVAP